MPMYATKPVQARIVDFDFPDHVADIAAWCGGKRFGRKLMVDADGRGEIAYPGWYVVETQDGGFKAIEPGLFLALFEPQVERKTRQPRVPVEVSGD